MLFRALLLTLALGAVAASLVTGEDFVVSSSDAYLEKSSTRPFPATCAKLLVRQETFGHFEVEKVDASVTEGSLELSLFTHAANIRLSQRGSVCDLHMGYVTLGRAGSQSIGVTASSSGGDSDSDSDGGTNYTLIYILSGVGAGLVVLGLVAGVWYMRSNIEAPQVKREERREEEDQRLDRIASDAGYVLDNPVAFSGCDDGGFAAGSGGGGGGSTVNMLTLVATTVMLVAVAAAAATAATTDVRGGSADEAVATLRLSEGAAAALELEVRSFRYSESYDTPFRIDPAMRRAFAKVTTLTGPAAQRTCAADTTTLYSGLPFPATAAGQWVEYPCPPGQTGAAKRRCGLNGAWEAVQNTCA